MRWGEGGGKQCLGDLGFDSEGGVDWGVRVWEINSSRGCDKVRSVIVWSSTGR